MNEETAPPAEALDPDKFVPVRGSVSADSNYMPPGKPAEHTFGVLYKAEYETEWDGTAVAARLHARALHDTGIPVLLQSFSMKFIDADGTIVDATQGIPERVEAEVGHLRRTSVSITTPCIKHVVVRNAEHLRQLVWPQSATAGFNDLDELVRLRERVFAQTILMSVWERDTIEPKIADQLKLLGECWVPCEQNAELLRGVGVQRVRVMPHPFDPADPICKLTERAPRTDGWRLFYAIGRWEPRKAFDRLIEAFLLAFTPNDSCMLTLKITGGNWPDYPTPQQCVQELLARDDIKVRGWTQERMQERVKVLIGRKPRSEILALHFYNNIYVSPSHGEAWNLPAFEAKLAGNLLVHVPFGGTKDFACRTDIAVPFGMDKVHPSYGWEENAQWAEYTTDDLVFALRAAKVPEKHERPPQMADYELTAVGKRMQQSVLELCAKALPAAAEQYRAMLQTNGRQ